MNNEELKAKKCSFIEAVNAGRLQWESTLRDIDKRLPIYFDTLCDDESIHNIYEYAAAAKFFRLLRRYKMVPRRVRQFFALYESIKFNGMEGRRTYKLTPIQVFQFASIFLFNRDDGTRLVRLVILFVPRKFGKTTSVASLGVNDLLYGDSNAQAYMAANSESQSGICFREAKNIIKQLDPEGKYFRVTESEVNWKANNLGKESSLTRLTSGGRTKDGANASLFIYDEYAAARYVKDHSEGAELFNVMTSSMGTRREPLTVVITTASRVSESPFERMLINAKADLLSEDETSDSQFASIFCPDPWMTHEDFGLEKTWKMCNPHIGITIREGFYADEWQLALRDQEKMREFLCKYLNVFLSDTIKDWITADDIRKRQVAIDDCLEVKHDEDVPTCILSMDFSRGDDLNCIVNMICFDEWQHDAETGIDYLYLFDCDAWISERTLESHHNRRLYERWVSEGWLRVCPGAVIDERMVVDRVAQVCDKMSVARIGYDPYDSSRYVSSLTELCVSLGGNPKKILRPVSQTWGSFNAPVQAFEQTLRMDGSPMAFTRNPILPWCFQNCYLEEDRNENVKPVKKTAAQKIDAAICALMCIKQFEEIRIKG